MQKEWGKTLGNELQKGRRDCPQIYMLTDFNLGPVSVLHFERIQW